MIGETVFYWLMFWAACGFVGSIITENRIGKTGIGFILGALFGPIGLLICLFVGSDEDKQKQKVAIRQRKKCPMCAELVQPQALICKHCGHRFDEVAA